MQSKEECNKSNEKFSLNYRIRKWCKFLTIKRLKFLRIESNS